MPAYAVIGGQWGDEGKGKIVDYIGDNVQALNLALNQKISKAADIIVRGNGGNNAGHTVWNPHGEFKLHLVPCGIANPRVRLSVIGPDVVVDTMTLDREDDDPVKRGEFQTIRDTLGVSVEDLQEKLRISMKAHLVFSWHIAEDFCQEVQRAIEARQMRGESDFLLKLSDISGLGTTRRGIGPAYADKAARFGIRIEDLLRPEDELRRILVLAWNRKIRLMKQYYLNHENISDEVRNETYRILGEFEPAWYKILQFREKFHNCFADVERLLYEANRAGQHILFEGAQGFLLDIDHGTYPYVTSSNCGTAGLTNCGITKFDAVIGVFKAYCTRVGSGDLPTEMIDDDDAQFAELIRQTAYEYGVTTGRARRIGWFDAAAARHSAILNGMTGLAITRPDIFDSIDFGSAGIKIGAGYNCVHNGTWKEKDLPQVRDIYCDNFDHWRCDTQIEPVYEKMRGWGSVPAHMGHKRVYAARCFFDMPRHAQLYIHKIEKLVGIPLRIVSTGPKRDQTIVLPSP